MKSFANSPHRDLRPRKKKEGRVSRPLLGSLPKEADLEQDLEASAVDLQRLTQRALLGPEGLRAVVVEILGRPLPSCLCNWNHGAIVEPMTNTPLGLLSRWVWTVPAMDNRLHVKADDRGRVILFFHLARGNQEPEGRSQRSEVGTQRSETGIPESAVADPGLLSSEGNPGDLPAEITLYANPDGPNGPEVLDALASLAAGVWPEDISFAHHPAARFPRAGTGPVWKGPDGYWHGPGDWDPLVIHPFQERFVRLPRQAVLARADATGRVVIPITVGRSLARRLAGLLRHRLFLNHAVLGNRVVERIEPDLGADGNEPLLLQGASPLVLECLDIDRGQHYFDQRFCRPGTDPTRLFNLDSSDGSSCQLKFLGTGVPQRRLRLAYLRPLDWDNLQVQAGQTVFEMERMPRFQAKSAIAPEVDATPRQTQIRQAFLERLLGFGRYRRWPTQADLVRLVWELMPAPVRAWVDGDPTEQRPLGLRFETEPRRRKRTAYMTRVVYLRSRPAAPRRELANLLSWLGRAVEERCGDGILVRVEWDE